MTGLLENRIAAKFKEITLPIFREIALLAEQHNALNLAGGVPDFKAPEAIKEAAIEAIRQDQNQYALTQGSAPLRHKISQRIEKKYQKKWNEETEITVCCGATEGVAATLLALLDPGDEVIIIEPAFTIYAPDVKLFGGVPIYLMLEAPDFLIQKSALQSLITEKTKAIILNSPHNPTGRIFGKVELDAIAELAIEHHIFVITDEIYDELYYEDEPSVKLWHDQNLQNQVIVINGFSKTYSVTGWRLGYIAAPAFLTKAIRVAHNYLTISAATPLQEAAASALDFPDTYYDGLRADYKAKRDYLLQAFEKLGIPCLKPAGGYFILADFTSLGWEDDIAFAKQLITQLGVAAIPLSGFYHEKTGNAVWLRFAFCKQQETLEKAVAKLQQIKNLKRED